MPKITKTGKIIIFLICAVALIFFSKSDFVKAQEYSIDGYNAKKILEKGIEDNYIVGKNVTIGIELVDENSLYKVIGRWIKLALSLIGIVLIILIIYAGYLWFAADGNEEQIGQAKSYIINAVIGIAIVLLAYAITYFIMGRISGTISGL
ncbi:hypothetical protein A2Y83_02530 [Candidatus Falkowbacteria bacterium RBG_13_39_14]|uniref:Uncharacterized protein n=1 Tax=Candidatus Falkowbacteria bacterium RBG_13_39_14 TaxID=1797985 RepID=A0A1F5S8I7_9BACT|nr:MAG: hypothetical protein A2Y83_02530 [Candidatus Falkowbacteria bacterium RBG_13_39_14]